MEQGPSESPGFSMKPRRVLIELGIVIGLLALGVALVVGGAGRLAGWLTPMLSPELDISMGKALSQSQKFMGQRCDNRELKAYLDSLTERLTQKLGTSPFKYEFSVVESDQVNAYALPGGFITLNFGLIKEAQSGEEIAAVLAHEIQHVELRHSTRSILRQVGGWTAMGMLFGDTAFQVPAYLLANAEFLSNSREQEADADEKGLLLLIRAGIQPRGFVTFFERLKADSLRPPEFFSSHPDPGNRVLAAEEQARRHRNFPRLPEPKGLRCRN